MVVNEMTSSVQKKGTKTVVAAAVACLASGAAFAAVNPADAQYAGAGAFVTWNGEAPSVPDANPIEMTGAQAQAIGGSGKNWVSVVKSSAGASGTMNNLDIDLTALGPNATPDKQLILVLSQGGGINFGGDKLNVVAKTDFIGGGNNQLAGIYSEADAGNSIGISAKNVYVNLASTAADGKSVYGVSSLGGKVNITSDALNIKLKTSTERLDSTQYSETAGISAGTFGNYSEKYRGYVGDITTSANTVVDVNVESTTAMATKPNNDSDFGGGSPVFGIRSEGGLINLAGTNKVTAVANGADAHGVYAVNYAYNSSLGLQKFNSEATVNNLTAKVTSKTGTAYGIHAKNNADRNTVAVNLTGDVDISASSTNSIGIYAVGQNVKMNVGEDGKMTRIFATGKDGQGIMTNTGAKLNVKGSSIAVSAADESGRGIAAWNGSTVNIGNEQTETVKVEGNFAGIISMLKGTTVNVVSKKIVVNSTDFGVHVQNNTEDLVAPTKHATLKLKADEINIKSTSLGLSAFSNGQMDVTGNLTVAAKNAIDVRGNSTMNINTDGKHTTVLNGDVVFETPNTPGDAQNSGKIINAYVSVGLHGEKSVWTGRSYQEYKVNDKYEHIVELEADPYHGNVTGFKTEISNGGKWNVTDDSFVNTLNLQGNATVEGNDAVTRFNAGEITVTGANNKLLFKRGTEVNAHLTVKPNADLTTRVDTAFASTLNDDIVTAAASKDNFVFEGGSTLHVDDAVKYTNAALEGMSKSYSNLSMVLDNGSLYVAPDAADRNIDIASNLTVNLKALGGQDLAGGADKFTIAGTVNVTAGMNGTTPVTGVTMNDVVVSGTENKAASLNLNNLQTKAKSLTVSNGTVSLRGEPASLTVGDLNIVDAGASLTAQKLDATQLKGEGTLTAENIVFAEKNDLSGFKGAATLNGGTYELTDQNAVRWFGGKTTLTGASVNLSKLTNAEGTLANITVDGGSLTAVSGQIFSTALSDTDYVDDPKAVSTKAGLKSGTLTFVDGKYNVAYASRADALLKGMKLVFMGSLVSAPAPEVPPAVEPSKEDLKTDDINKLNPDNNVIFDSALDTADKKHDSLVIGSTSDVNASADVVGIAETITSNVGVSQIKLPDQTDLVAVNSNRTLTLIGTGANESLIATETGATLEVGGKETGGVLALGVQSDAVANAGTLNVDTNIGQKGLVEVNAGNFTASKKVTNNGQLVVKEGAALAVGGSLELKAGSNTAVEGILNTAKDAKLNVETGAKLALNGVAAIEQIDVTKHDNHEEALVTVGDNAKAGKAIIKKLGVGAEHLTFFLDPIWQEGAGISDASSLALTDLSSGVTSKFIVGQNSVLSLGATTAVAEQAFADIAHVNGKTWGEDITAAAYADKPVDLGSTGGLVINGGLTSSGTVVTPTAKDVNVASKGMLIINQDNVVADRAFFTAGSEDAKVTLANGSYVAIVNAVKDAAPVKLAETVDNWGADVVTDNPFFSGSIATNTLTTKFESESGLAAIASTGIQSMARRADFVMSETVANRTSLDQQLNADFNLWVDITGERYEADKLDNNGSFRSDAGYAMFGGDMQVAEGFTAGMALQYGDASVRSDISSIKNSIKSYGLTAYAGQKFGDAKVVGELAWLKSENKITASQTAMNQKLDVNVYSAGVRAQYELAAGAFKFVPSIGLRVSHLETDDMTIGTIKATDSDLTYVQMPISLRISGGEVAASGWTFAPSFKVAYVPTFGDKEIKVYGASQDVLDMSPVQADFGLRAVNGNLMFNADMMIGGGEYGTSSIGGKVGVKYVF